MPNASLAESVASLASLKTETERVRSQMDSAIRAALIPVGKERVVVRSENRHLIESETCALLDTLRAVSVREKLLRFHCDRGTYLIEEFSACALPFVMEDVLAALKHAGLA